ncbi:MAG: hypothetical protein M9894_32450 [Planctomycetes bacterium]|nr:hypothetical protein [Planctomycetota bacterium]
MANAAEGRGVIVPDRVALDLLARCARDVLAEAESDRPGVAEVVRGKRLVVGRLAGAAFLGADLRGVDDPDEHEALLASLAEAAARASNDLALAWWARDGAEGVSAFRGEASLCQEERSPDDGEPATTTPGPLALVAAGLGRDAGADAALTPASPVEVALDAPLDAAAQAGLGPGSPAAEVEAAVARLAAALAAEAPAAAGAPPAASAPAPDQRGAYLLVIGLAVVALVLTVVFSVMASLRG